MSQEIIYTSAQKGLRSGSFGFCTVCSTAGMEPNMADFLEGISAYPHPYKPPDPRTSQNPVNFSHIIWTIGGQRFHVLSRVCDAGLDYTGRTNLLAHHIALTRREAEAAIGGPAFVLTDDHFTVSQWDGQLRTLPGRRPRMDDVALEPCRNWQLAAGDAGYAGVLAESCLEKGGRPVTVIYKAGTDVLALVSEALSLLPAEKRWNVTFSTFYTKIYSSFECQWRFVFTGSPDAAVARKNPHSFVIDLAGPKPPEQAKGGALVEAARAGQFSERQAAAPLTASAGVYVPSSSRTRPPNLPPIPQPNPLGEVDARLRPPEMVTAANQEPIAAVPNPFHRRPRKTSGMTLAVAFLGSLCVSLIAILAFMILRKPPENRVVQVPYKNIQPPVTPRENPSKRTANDKKHRPETDTEPAVAVPINVEPEPKPMDPVEPSPATTVPEPTKPVEPPPPVEPDHPPMFDLKERKGRLRLPARTGGPNLSGTSGPSAGPLLAKVYAPMVSDCDLTLLGVEKAFGSALSGNIKLDRKDVSGVRSWAVIRMPIGALSGNPVTLGTFRLTGQDLSFHWNPTVPPSAKPDALRYCMLKVEVGGDSQVCRLSEPMEVPPIKFEKLATGSAFKVDLPRMDASMLPDVESLSLQIKPVDFPGKVEQIPAEPIPPGKSQSIQILGKTDKEGALLELTVLFSFDKDKDNEDGREIRVKGVENYLGKLNLKDAIESGRPLSIKDLNVRLKDKKDRVKVFEQKAKKEDNDLQKENASLKPKIDQLTNFAKISKDKEAIKEAERKKEGLVEELRRVQESADIAKEKVIDAKGIEKQVQETLDLAQQLIDKKSSLEYRIFIMVNEEEVELYRSKGFTREF